MPRSCSGHRLRRWCPRKIFSARQQGAPVGGGKRSSDNTSLLGSKQRRLGPRRSTGARLEGEARLQGGMHSERTARKTSRGGSKARPETAKRQRLVRRWTRLLVPPQQSRGKRGARSPRIRSKDSGGHARGPPKHRHHLPARHRRNSTRSLGSPILRARLSRRQGKRRRTSERRQLICSGLRHRRLPTSRNPRSRLNRREGLRRIGLQGLALLRRRRRKRGRSDHSHNMAAPRLMWGTLKGWRRGDPQRELGSKQAGLRAPERRG